MGYSPRGHKELDTTRLTNFTFTFHFHALKKAMATHSSGPGSLVGCRLWGRTESDTTEVTQQQPKDFPGGPSCKEPTCPIQELQETMV